MKTILKYLSTNNLYTNSFYLIGSYVLAYVSGFLFWLLVTRLYSTQQVGVATALFSSASLISTLSLLGFNTSLLKFIPQGTHNNEKINSSIIITAVVSGVLSVLFLIFSPFFLSETIFIKETNYYFILFVLFTIIFTLNLLSDSVFVALRSTYHVFIKTAFQSTIKLALPFLFIASGAFGIFISLSVGALGALMYAFISLAMFYGVKYQFKLHVHSIKEMAYLSFGTYISGLITTIPSFLLPLFITSTLNSSAAAYYFIAATTVNFLYIIPQMVTQNLLVESTKNEPNLKILLKKTFYLINVLLIPAILLMIFFGNYILIIFGKNYSVEGLTLLQVMSVAGIFVGLNYIFGILLIIYEQIKFLIGINFLGTIVLLLLSYWFLGLGITGIGYATLLTQLILTLLYIGALARMGKIYLLRYLF